MKGAIRRRFIERDYVKRQIMINRTYITEDDADNIIYEMKQNWFDLTFKFIPCGKTGWNIEITDNDLERKVDMDELNSFACEWLCEQLKDLAFKQIKEILDYDTNRVCGNIKDSSNIPSKRIAETVTA